MLKFAKILSWIYFAIGLVVFLLLEKVNCKYEMVLKFALITGLLVFRLWISWIERNRKDNLPVQEPTKILKIANNVFGGYVIIGCIAGVIVETRIRFDYDVELALIFFLGALLLRFLIYWLEKKQPVNQTKDQSQGGEYNGRNDFEKRT